LKLIKTITYFYLELGLLSVCEQPSKMKRSIVMNNIKTLNELRKLIRDTKWLEIKFNKDEILNQFDYNFKEENLKYNGGEFTQPDEKVEEYIFNRNRFKHSIDKKKQEDVYKIGLTPIKTRDRFSYSRYKKYSSLYAYQLPKGVITKEVKGHAIYEFIGNRSKYDSFYPSNTLFWVDNYSDQILFVKYKRKDIWFNNFFRSKLDSSVKNNYEEIFSNKKFNFLYEQTNYKVFSASGLDYEDARKKLEKENSQLQWITGRINGKWTHLGKSKVDKTPEGKFDANNLLDRFD